MAAMHGMMQSHDVNLDAIWNKLGPTTTFVDIASKSSEAHIKRYAIACLSLALRRQKSTGSTVGALGGRLKLVHRDISFDTDFDYRDS